MGLKDNKIVYKSKDYLLKTKVVKRKTKIPLVIKKYKYLVGYKLNDNTVRLDDKVFVTLKFSCMDPFRIFLRSRHAVLTRQALKKYKFDNETIKECVKHNVQTDTKNLKHKYLHYAPHTHLESSKYIKQCLHNAIYSPGDIKLFWLGRGLHTLQDKFAHYEQQATTRDHVPFRKDPDNPEKHPYLYWRAYQESIRYIKMYLNGKQYINDMRDEKFLRAITNEIKIKLVMA